MDALDHFFNRKQNEDTTMANITYLPSGLGAVKSALRNLAKQKPEWNIEILENEKGHKVVFEDALSIFVPRQWWNDFSLMFDEHVETGTIGLYKHLNEAMRDEIDTLKREIQPALTKMLNEDQFAVLDHAVEQWESRFGIRSYKPIDALINVERKQNDIQRLDGALKRAYGSDRGNLQILLESIRKQNPLNSFNIFKDKNFLYGTRILSRHDASDMIFEATIDMGYFMGQSIQIINEDIVREFENYPNVRVVKNTIYPINKTFDTKILFDLEDELEEALDNES